MSAAPAMRIAIVTGGHSRVGRTISEALAARGWRVLLHAFRGTARAEALDQQLNPPPDGPMGIWQADFSDTAATLASFETLLATLPAEAELALVHNASAFENDDRDSVTLERFRMHHAVHYEVPVLLTLAAAQRFPRGQALMVLDQNVENLHDQFLSYCLSKGAMHAAMKRLALALAPFRVNAVAPGPTLPLPDADLAAFDAAARATPLQGAVAPEDVADAVAWLLDARRVTAQTVFVDAGQHLKQWREPAAPGA
ncbi:SDR family oxidoreductase [Sphaerotilus montanus]|uniref:SDR family oxidoreductase n=1 Tax=Sphaerotilus montanus TaxID=522889 RepID=UPI003FA33C6F